MGQVGQRSTCCKRKFLSYFECSLPVLYHPLRSLCSPKDFPNHNLTTRTATLSTAMPARTSPSTGFKPLEKTTLFEPLQMGHLRLKHRAIMAPLTRMRAPKETDGIWVPGDLNVEYYSQRASEGGFQLTEACPISRQACGYPGVPGIFTASQIAGWKRITDAIHAKGGFIYCKYCAFDVRSSCSCLGQVNYGMSVEPQ